MAAARHYTDRVLDDLRSRGCVVVEVDGEQVVFGVPPQWSATVEQQVTAAAATYLPPRVALDFVDRYEALYARGPGATMTLGTDGVITLIGPAFRSGRLERFGEAFLQRAAQACLSGDVVGLRQAFLDTVHLLRSRQVRVEDLCTQVTLHKSPQQYRRGGTHEEPYEALLAAGVRSWRVGQRIRYFRTPGGEPRLLQEGDGLNAADADMNYYVERLGGLYCQQFTQAFRREDYVRIFRLPTADGPYEVVADEVAGITPIATPTR